MAGERQPTEYYNQHFKEAIVQVWNRYLVADQKADILEFLMTDSSSMSFYLAFTPEGLHHLTEQVFSSSVIRDFVMMTYSLFATKIDKDGDEMEVLINRLAKAYAVGELVVEGGTSIVPETIHQRLPVHQVILDYLRGNSWLVVLSMIDQAVNLADIVGMSNPAPQGKRK